MIGLQQCTFSGAFMMKIAAFIAYDMQIKAVLIMHGSSGFVSCHSIYLKGQQFQRPKTQIIASKNVLASTTQDPFIHTGDQ